MWLPESTRTLIVDDERLARLELRRLLAEHPGFDVVGEAGSCAEARQEVALRKPNLLLLDIQLPDGDGFGLLRTLEAAPPVIFTTAYETFAVEAFEVNAIDYLLKPVESSRLAQALRRLAHRSDAETASEARQGALGPSDRVLVRDRDRCRLVTVSEILLLEAAGSRTRIVVRGPSDARLTAPRSLSAVEERLDPDLFVRANRRQVINIRWIRELDDDPDGPLTARLEGGALVRLSRRRAREFRRRMEL
ncbi:MAG: LytTR family DNA-binding domain-containing protein [Thermoanaerobaculia bacterium]|nr:LytTR family DNA-binding domain-containing protein [Thermoanaerobaculia bacterium]